MKHYLIENTELMKDWDYEKNKSINPSDISINSNIRINWKCHVCGHEWTATPNHRTRDLDGGRHSGCPMCSKEYVNNFNKVQIINLNIGKIYNSLTEAAISIGVNKATLCCHLNGRNKT